MLCFWGATTLAMPWATDPARAEAVRRHLEQLWPGAPIEVVPLPLSGDGIEERDGKLRYIRDGVEVAVAGASDARTEVVLVRSWSRNPEIAGTGWFPTPTPVGVPAPAPAPAPDHPAGATTPPTPATPPEPTIVPEVAPTSPIVSGAGAGAGAGAGRVAAILGLRAGDQVLDGVRLGARYSRGPWAAELTGFLATGDHTRRSRADELTAVTGGVWFDPRDLAVASLALHRSFPLTDGFRLGGSFGVEARSYVSRRKAAVADVAVEVLGPFLDVGPELGLSLAWTPDPAVALRLGVAETLRWRRNDLSVSPTLGHQPRLWLDLVLGPESARVPPKDSARRDNGTGGSPP